MSLHRAVRAGLVLLSAIGVTTMSIGASAAAPAAAHAGADAQATAPTLATAAWSFIRRACRTYSAGTACVNLEGNGQPSTYRVVYQLQPKSGQWMRPLSTATWLGSDRTVTGTGAVTRYRPFCSTTCPVVRTATNVVVTSPYYAVYTMILDTPAGHVDVSAGVTPSVSQTGQVPFCIPGSSVTATAFLTSTSDGTVYYARSGETEAGNKTFDLYDNTPADSRRFFTTTLNANKPYTSRTFYTGWQRFPRSDGSWQTQGVVAANDYINSTSTGLGSC